MINKNQIMLQDTFLNYVRKEHMPVLIHLINGFQIRGLIKGFDNYVLIVETDGKQMMLYKQAISTITPTRTVQLSYEKS